MFTAWVRYQLPHNKEISQANKTQNSLLYFKTTVQIYLKVRASPWIRLRKKREHKQPTKGPITTHSMLEGMSCSIYGMEWFSSLTSELQR